MRQNHLFCRAFSLSVSLHILVLKRLCGNSVQFWQCWFFVDKILYRSFDWKLFSMVLTITVLRLNDPSDCNFGRSTTKRPTFDGAAIPPKRPVSDIFLFGYVELREKCTKKVDFWNGGSPLWDHFFPDPSPLNWPRFWIVLSSEWDLHIMEGHKD